MPQPWSLRGAAAQERRPRASSPPPARLLPRRQCSPPLRPAAGLTAPAARSTESLSGKHRTPRPQTTGAIQARSLPPVPRQPRRSGGHPSLRARGGSGRTVGAGPAAAGLPPARRSLPEPAALTLNDILHMSAAAPPGPVRFRPGRPAQPSPAHPPPSAEGRPSRRRALSPQQTGPGRGERRGGGGGAGGSHATALRVPTTHTLPTPHALCTLYTHRFIHTPLHAHNLTSRFTHPGSLSPTPSHSKLYTSHCAHFPGYTHSTLAPRFKPTCYSVTKLT